MQKSGGRHRATQSSQWHNAVERASRKLPGAGAAGVALTSAAVLGLSPTIATGPQLAANVYDVPGTKIGDVRTESEFEAFADAMIAGSVGGPSGSPHYIDYPGGFRPVSAGGLSDPTYDQSVEIGLGVLESEHPGDGDVIVGFSQGAVIASKYKASDPNTKITYVLVENPNRPNGGILQRFNGLHVPILDVSFNGPTVDNGAPTVDISRQYDGWSDFPTYPLNFVATANAIAGIALLHGDTQDITDPAVLQAIKADGNPMYYQQHGSTTYYVIPTERLPLLMPFSGIVPEPVLDALDPPLRAVVELGYDRTDYSAPTPAKLIPTPSLTNVPAQRSDSAIEPAKPPELGDVVTTRPSKDASPARVNPPRTALLKPVRTALRALTPKSRAGKSHEVDDGHQADLDAAGASATSSDANSD
ncbi:hypothetical protein BH09ACT7_BH09ACT7_30440 [soil metagenome]